MNSTRRILIRPSAGFPLLKSTFSECKPRHSFFSGLRSQNSKHITFRRFQSTFPQDFAQPIYIKKPLWRRALNFFAIGITFTSLGLYISLRPTIKTIRDMANPPSDAETLKMFTPGDDISQTIESHITNHPIAVELRTRPGFSESRPHLKVPEEQRKHNLTAGTLMGPGKIVVPPFVWTEEGGKSLVSISYLGTDLCGHVGIVHGGVLATLLDEGLAGCCFKALPNKIGMTANLNINYRAPARAGSFIVLRATTTKVEGRKAWVEGRIETLVAEGETPVVLAEASALFIEPKSAATMAKIYAV